MKKFFDVVKVNLDEDIERYFQNVEIESIKMTKDKKTLNFYLVSNELIPFDILKEAEHNIASELLYKNYNEDSIDANGAINFNIRYMFNEDMSCKKIFELAKKDLLKELKTLRPMSYAFLRTEYIDWVDDNTLRLGFDHLMKINQQDYIVDFFKNVFRDRFNRDLKIEILWLEINYGVENKKKDIKTIENIKDIKGDIIHKTSNESITKNIRRDRKSQINLDGNVLYGKPSKLKRIRKEISDLQYEMDNIEVKGVIYNLKKHVFLGKGTATYSVFITDNEGCIEIKFFGSENDIGLFDKRFLIGAEIEVGGRVVNDSWARTLVIKPSVIVELGKRLVIENGKPDDKDYYNEIITDRADDEKIKRVELHLHTKSSTQDGIGDVRQYILTAKKFGMNAMAITDHGSVNALADANEYLNKTLNDKEFKVINGVEGYLVEDNTCYYFDDQNNEIDDNYPFDGKYVIYKLLTTGLNRKNDAIISIEAVKIEHFKKIDEFKSFVRYENMLSFDIKEKTGIKQSELSNAPELKEVLEKFLQFVDNACLITLNNNTTWKLGEVLIENGFNGKHRFLDFLSLSRLFLKNLKTFNIISIAKELGIKVENILGKKKVGKKDLISSKDELLLSAESVNLLFNNIKNEYGISDLQLLKGKIDISDDFIRKQKYYHIILLAKNDVGRVNLYKLVSDSHIRYMYNKRPRIPRSLLVKYREGLIIGSACILGELMDAIKNSVDDEELKSIASFYDYLEIQPTLNNSFLLNSDSANFKSITDLENLNKKVIKIGEELDKPVVATCDCHYVDKGDKIYREILRVGTTNKKSNIDKDGKVKAEISSELENSNEELLYFRTTKEMLDEFSYLGIDKAYEVVVKNTNLISDMIEKIYPVRPDNCPPHIEGSENELIESCYENLKRLFGDNPPEVIKNRLDNELKYIIDNGYSVMYIAAKKLIDYSKECGYPVGSRGSVGSSLAATLSGVSEVNPLKPYYVCPKCHHIEYDTDETRQYENDTGFDMPDKNCPNCNTLMVKDGINIPFETFLGIPGDKKAQKEPDIDLNFCSVFQSSIHEKTIELFGKENTFKAGTVGTIAAKTAYGFVKRFEEIAGIDLNQNQVDYFKNKIVECKNTTGQHPGGMVVVPKNEKIYTFTPIQIAADKEENDITTHFDYHKIDKNLLKLDILGHEAPLLLKKLHYNTGVNFEKVPFYEKEVLSLFENTESLHIKPSDISGTKLGCLTIPEFGTDFAMNMCIEAKPKTVADLIRIAGLAHGTDVWQGNVQELIKNNDCTLSTAICCRDDIMIYLKEKGIDSGIAFNIMERVRKGKKLTDENKEIMREHNVPEWYIGCCDKIQYMFPKAHAAAYVLASLRIAYYKVHYPHEYYASYFSINKDGFDYKLMMADKEEIHYRIEKLQKIINERKSKDKSFAEKMNSAERPMDAIKKLYNTLSGIEEKDEKVDNNEESADTQYENMSAKKLFDLYMCYRHVEEMKARGIEFCPIDIYNAKRSDFQVINGKIMPSFDSLTGIGTKDYDIDYNDDVPKEQKSTAMRCEIESKKGEYSSIENFISRTGVNKTRIEEMKALGLFGDLREKEELTLFDYIDES